MSNVYFITCHRSAENVADLFRFIYHSDNIIIIHCDRKAPENLHRLVLFLAALWPNVIVLPSRFYSWAGYSMMETTLEAMRVALGLERSWRHFFWVSEQHLPLAPQDSDNWRLPSDISMVDCAEVRNFPPDRIQDVRHRFRRRFRELPGVGGFAIGPSGLSLAIENRLWQGSNWMALTPVACRRLLQRATYPDGADFFRHSLHADETMLQTLLMNNDDGVNLPVRQWNPSWIAWPHLSGSGEMVFNDANIVTARQGGHLFIRKRPDQLPDWLRTEMESTASISADGLMEQVKTAERQNVPRRPVVPQAFLQAIAAGLSEPNGPEVRRLLPLELMNVPTLYLVIPLTNAPHNLRVCVLSENLIDFKVLVVVDLPFSGNFGDVPVFGQHTELLRVRVHDMFLSREIPDPTDETHGFLALKGEDPRPLLTAIRARLAFARSLVQ